MKLTISGSPHLSAKLATVHLMRQVIIALLPAVAAAVFFFRLDAVFLILNCVASAFLTEVVINKIRKVPWTVGDYSAVLTGLLLALILPPSIAWYGATLGSVFAIVVGKHIFGGLGSNIFNPALIARAFLMAAYPKMLTTFVAPVDAVTSATPLALRKFSHQLTPLGELFWGNVSGSLGETSAFCLIIGGVYLLIRKIAGWRIPLTLILTVVVVSFIGSMQNAMNGSIGFNLFSGGLLIGAFFMATDPVTSPITKKGRYIFGLGCGIVIMVIRYFSGLPEGVMYSILFMNAFTPLINQYTRPKRFGA